MILGDGLVGFLLLGFWIWALLDVISTDAAMCRNLPKMAWVVIVLILPVVGSIIWLLAGRPEKGSWRPGSTDYAAPRRPVGLEDSPRYGASPEASERRSEELNDQLERWEREQRAKQLDAREAELRRRELELRERERDLDP